MYSLAAIDKRIKISQFDYFFILIHYAVLGLTVVTCNTLEYDAYKSIALVWVFVTDIQF